MLAWMTVFFPTVVDDGAGAVLLQEETNKNLHWLTKIRRESGVHTHTPDIVIPVVRRGAQRRPDGGRAVCLGQ